MVDSGNDVPSVHFPAVSRSSANEVNNLHPTILSFSTSFTPRVTETLSHNVGSPFMFPKLTGYQGMHAELQYHFTQFGALI